MKRRLFMLSTALFLFGAGIFGTSQLYAGDCTEGKEYKGYKNKFLSFSGCTKEDDDICVIIRCPLVVKIKSLF